jgi:hypothetical protein
LKAYIIILYQILEIKRAEKMWVWGRELIAEG